MSYRNSVQNNLNNVFYKHCCFGWMPARLVLYLLSLSGISVSFIMRIAINLTILAMVKEKPAVENFNSSETCYETTNTTNAAIDYGGTLDWSIDVQYYILTSFYWTYILSQIFGGIAAQKFGTKKVFGWSLFITSICNLCIPVCSSIHYVIVIILQAIHGLSQGFTWPAIYAVIGHWIPIQERSRFVTCFQGLSLGTTLANLMSGFIIAKIGWAYVFYAIGTIGLLCSLLWFLLIHDKPEQHPRISKQELRYIQENREQSLHSQKKIPWVSILTSLPVWAIGITSFGRMWLCSVILVYGPLYLKTIIGLKVELNGLLLGVSSFAAFLSALFFSFISDKLVAHKLVSLRFNRKMFSTIGQVIPGVFAIVIGHLNCNISLIITTWFLIQIFLTAGFPGSMTNIVDISPSYTAPVSAFVQCILLLPTILATLLVKTLLQEENSSKSWRIIFYISSGVVIGTSLFYTIFASAEVQSWDRSRSLRKRNKRKKEKLDNDTIELYELDDLTNQSTRF
ncbi:hypothetical protein RN001_014050 [Aquatica leii]|uniref:Major facilitator superfamily (MFS) profile domain-containing protein n=1 Tax=Aquatica leii TaxID=1421715 RepID=A0AAN7NX00_9COLE|nr:hypothetical protein RN001_014050 [Aquatica leii]